MRVTDEEIFVVGEPVSGDLPERIIGSKHSRVLPGRYDIAAVSVNGQSVGYTFAEELKRTVVEKEFVWGVSVRVKSVKTSTIPSHRAVFIRNCLFPEY